MSVQLDIDDKDLPGDIWHHLLIVLRGTKLVMKSRLFICNAQPWKSEDLASWKRLPHCSIGCAMLAAVSTVTWVLLYRPVR